LIASRRGGEALIIDPVLEKVDHYLQLMRELDLRLVKAVDTHLHADHITGPGALRDRTHCVTVMGEQSSVDVVSMRIADRHKLRIEGISMDLDPDEYLGEVPLVSGVRPTAAHRMGKAPAELLAPPPHRLVRDGDAALD